MLVIIDMQKDFIDGIFGTREAQVLVPRLENFIEKYEGQIYITYDSHSKRESIEEKMLPAHCLQDSDGYYYPSSLLAAIKQNNTGIYIKHTFGDVNLCNDLKNEKEVYLCGLCTDICIISNALMMRSICPNTKITVISDLCAGTTPENHQKALDIMQNNLIEIKKVEEL